MGWLDIPARVFCSVSGGHEFARHGGFLVCDYCGKRVEVGADG